MSLLPRTDTNLSTVPPPTRHKNMPSTSYRYQHQNMEGLGFVWGFCCWLDFYKSEGSHSVTGEKSTWAGTPAAWNKVAWSWLSCLPRRWVLAVPPSSENDGLSLARLAQNACQQQWHHRYATARWRKMGISVQAEHPEHPILPVSLWQQVPHYFEIKRLKKCGRMEEILPGMFWMCSTET